MSSSLEDLDVSSYVGSGSDWIRWGALLGTLVGGAWLAFVGAVVRLGEAVVLAHARLLGATETFLGQLLGAVFVDGASIVRLGWRSAFLSTVDVAGPVVAPLLVTLDLLVIASLVLVLRDRVI
jgi:hypothetical protein